MARSNGGEPNAGRQLHAWARKAGFDRARMTATAGTWCYNTHEERVWWSELWADRTVHSAFAKSAIDNGCASMDELESIAETWRKWGAEEDGWFTLIHGEILCRK